MEQLVVDVLWRRGADRVTRDIDTDVGAAGAEDAHTAFDVGVGGIFLTRSGAALMRGDVSFQILVAYEYGDVDIVDKEEAVGVVLEVVFDDREETVGGDGLGCEGAEAVHVD